MSKEVSTTMTPVLRTLIPFVLAAAGLAAPASAQNVFTFLARADGAQETPPVPTNATGLAAITIDTVSNTLTYRVNFVNLSSNEILAHIHGFAPPGMAAGILFNFPLGTPKCGTFTFTEGQQANILAGLTYVNIHSSNFGGGEIRGQIAEAPAHTNLCFGDGTSAACPCGNSSAVGEAEGCLNSLGTGARLRAYGSASLSNDTLVMHHSRGTDSSVLLFQGAAQAGGGLGVPFGDGLRCVTSQVQRLGTKTACNGQQVWPDLGETPLGTFAVAGNVFYQTWYRNAAAFCTASTFNLSNAVQVTWTP
jgi:hypothetical protein